METKMDGKPLEWTRPVIRLHCMRMAVDSARLLGRGDAFMDVAKQMFEWVMETPPAPAPASGDATPGTVRPPADLLGGDR